MRAVHSALIHRLAAAIAATTTAMALFSAVVAISEPHRSGLVAADAASCASPATTRWTSRATTATACSAASAAGARTHR